MNSWESVNLINAFSLAFHLNIFLYSENQHKIVVYLWTTVRYNTSKSLFKFKQIIIWEAYFSWSQNTFKYLANLLQSRFFYFKQKETSSNSKRIIKIVEICINNLEENIVLKWQYLIYDYDKLCTFKIFRDKSLMHKKPHKFDIYFKILRSIIFRALWKCLHDQLFNVMDNTLVPNKRIQIVSNSLYITKNHDY